MKDWMSNTFWTYNPAEEVQKLEKIIKELKKENENLLNENKKLAHENYYLKMKYYVAKAMVECKKWWYEY